MEPAWTFLTNHGHALLCIARDPGMRLRDIATAVGVTERTAQRIVNDLVEAGYVTRDRIGVRSRYRVNGSLPLRHPLESEHLVAELLAALVSPGSGG